MSLIRLSDGITPDLRRRARAAGNRRPLLEAMGTAFVAAGREAFSTASRRAAPWAPRQDAKPHPLLLDTGSLERSLRVDPPSNTSVRIVSDRPYAAVHQLGGEHLPARPFLPFYPDSGRITDFGRRRVENALRAALRVRGL
jgi:phage gpG-like protein